MQQALLQLEALQSPKGDPKLVHNGSDNSGSPPTVAGGGEKPQRMIRFPWWSRLNWQASGKHGLRLVVFVLGFVACSAVGKSGKAGLVAHLFAGLINPIPLILAMGCLGLYALLNQKFSALLLAHELLLAFLIAQEIVHRFI